MMPVSSIEAPPPSLPVATGTSARPGRRVFAHSGTRDSSCPNHPLQSLSPSLPLAHHRPLPGTRSLGDSLPSASAREMPGVRAASSFSRAASSDCKPPISHSPWPQIPVAGSAALPRPPPAGPGRNVSTGSRPQAPLSIPGGPSLRSHSHSSPPSTSAQTSPNAQRPVAPTAFTPQNAAAPPGRKQKCLRGDQSPPEQDAASLPQPHPPIPTPPPGLPRSASRGSAPAQETLRTCPGSQDSSSGSGGSQRTDLWRPATIEGGPEALSPCLGPRRCGWSDYPVPILAR